MNKEIENLIPSELADLLDGIERRGDLPDEPEGRAVVIFSDTLLRQISARIRQYREPKRIGGLLGELYT